MPRDLKKVISTEFMKLCRIKHVEKITIQEILEVSEISRKTFYNHFKDKNDLIQYCYTKTICPQWYVDADDTEGMKKWTIEWLENIKEHLYFMKAACESREMNSLQEYILGNDRTDDVGWFMALKDSRTENDDVKYFVDYHAAACRFIIIEWLMGDAVIPVAKLEEMIRFNRESLLGLLKEM